MGKKSLYYLYIHFYELDFIVWLRTVSNLLCSLDLTILLFNLQMLFPRAIN